MDKCKRCEYYLKDDLYFYCRAKKEMYEDDLMMGICPMEKNLNEVVSTIFLAIQDRTDYEVFIDKILSNDAIGGFAYYIKCKVQPLPFYNKSRIVRLYISNFNKNSIICGYKTVVKEFIRSIKEYEEMVIDEIHSDINEAIEDNKIDNGKR